MNILIIIIIIIIILIVAYIVFLLLPAENTITFIIQKICLYFPLPASIEIKNEFANYLIGFTLNTRNATIIFFKSILVDLLSYVPESVLKATIQSYPNTYISPSQCIVKEKKMIGEEIPLPEDLPWDEKISYCESRLGTIKDIDLTQRLEDANPKIILY